MSAYKWAVLLAVVASPVSLWLVSESLADVECNTCRAKDPKKCNADYDDAVYCQHWTAQGDCDGHDGADKDATADSWNVGCTDPDPSHPADHCINPAADCLQKYRCGWDDVASKCIPGVKIQPDVFYQTPKAKTESCVPPT